MTIEQIIEYIIIILPQIIQIVTVVALFLRRAAEMRNLNSKVTDLTCIDDLKKEIQALIAENREARKENRELKKKLNETMTLIDHVRRKD